MMFQPWWGSRFEEPKPLSVLEIVQTGTLDLRTAGLLWLLMEQRASVLVAAGPSSAGKSTMLNVLLDFLPPSVRTEDLHGQTEDFAFLKDGKPAETYMVAAEFNVYLDYVWGEVARTAFRLLTEGYGLGGTIHAETAREAVQILHHYLRLPVAWLSRLDVVVTLSVSLGRNYTPVRRLETVSLIVPEGKGITLRLLASRELSGAMVLADEKTLQAAITAKLPRKDLAVDAEITRREHFLARLAAEGKVTRGEVLHAVRGYTTGQGT